MSNEKQEAGFLGNLAGAGYDNLSLKDYALPFLKIAQAQSPELLEDDPKYIPGLKPGMFFNSLKKTVYGNTVKLIPIWYDCLWLEWAPNRGGIKGRHKPGSIKTYGDVYGKLLSESGNEIVETMTYYVRMADHPEDKVLILSLSKTGLKAGKFWNTCIANTELPNGGQAPFFGAVWELKTVLQKNKLGAWYGIDAQEGSLKKVRFINELEYTSHVAPSLKEVRENQDRVLLEDTSAMSSV